MSAEVREGAEGLLAHAVVEAANRNACEANRDQGWDP